jgi:hypothetical protein
MKKITLLALLALGLSFASCKKDRTCTCTTTSTVTYTGVPGLTTETSTSQDVTTLKEVNGKSARANCLSYEMAPSTINIGPGMSASVSGKTDCALD